jgi:hypothetical protein
MTVPNFVGTIWETKVLQPSVRQQGTKVIFRDNFVGSAYFLDDGPNTQYDITWSVDAGNQKLSWSMPNVFNQGGIWYPLDFRNWWQPNYNTGDKILMNLGCADHPVSGGTSYNFTQLQVQQYP